MTPEPEHKTIKTNGVNLHVVQAGPDNGPLVILLHGFPEFWYGWQAQIPALVEAGFRVWVPDQRGYNLSDKPTHITDYDLNKLAADVIGLIDAAGSKKALLVGHDWGANVAWWTAIHYPQRLKKLVILNVPHPAVFSQTLRRNPRQVLKSWYVFFFQIPWLPEKLISLNNWRLGTRSLIQSSRPGTFSPTDLEEYRQAWSEDRAMTTMINWYRAIVQHKPKMSANPRIKVPTLVIWGAKDRFLSLEMAQPSAEMCDEGRLEVIKEATHWVQHEEAERVNKLLIEFFKKPE